MYLLRHFDIVKESTQSYPTRAIQIFSLSVVTVVMISKHGQHSSLRESQTAKIGYAKEGDLKFAF